MLPYASVELLKVCSFTNISLSLLMTPISTENNLFLVKRLIQRTDMRNPDPGPKRYTSLAWAAVLGHEETFEFLLTAGHDDEELSRVCARH
jgi:ankyrin repeat protein